MHDPRQRYGVVHDFQAHDGLIQCMVLLHGACVRALRCVCVCVNRWKIVV